MNWYTTSQTNPADSNYLNLAKNPEQNKIELQRIVGEAAKRAGYNIGPVYHGSPNLEFKEFDPKLIGSKNDRGYLGRGFYFSSNKESASTYGTDLSISPRAFFLKIINPQKGSWSSGVGYMSAQEYNPKYQDGAFWKHEDGSVEFVVEKPNQIKLADPITYDNSGNIIPIEQRFQSSNQDIRY